MKSIKLMLLLLLILNGLPALADNECMKFVEPKNTELTSYQSRLALAMAQQIKKLKRLPSADELAWHLKMPKPEMLLNLESLGTVKSPILELGTLAKRIHPQPFQELRNYLARKIATFFMDNLRPPTDEEILELVAIRDTEEFDLLYESRDGLFTLAKTAHPNHFVAARAKILRSYTKIAVRTGRIPKLEEVANELEMDPAQFNANVGEGRLFSSLKELKESAWDEDSARFRYVVDTDIYNEERLEAMMRAIKNRERLIVTTAVAGAKVNREFFASLQNYAAKMDAEILIFPANMETTGLDPILLETPGVHIVTNTIHFSPHLALNKIKIIAKQINPLMGLDNIGGRGQSQIVGSPKMHERTVPTVENRYYPHRLMTTGAVTDPLYEGDRYIQGRTDEIAYHDHVIGALVLEKNQGRSKLFDLEMTGNFHKRFVEFIPERNGFYDLGRFYSDKQVSTVAAEALVLGDIHVGETDQRLLDKVRGLVKVVNPKLIVLHDLLNGHSISHHDQNKLILLAEKARLGQLNLEQEIRAVVGFLNAVLSVDKRLRLVIVPSNHNDWLPRWLQSGQFMKEPQNTDLGLELAQVLRKGQSPFEYAILKFGLEYPKRVDFLQTGASFRVGPSQHVEGVNRLVELGLHGHAGANGAKGSLKQLRTGAGRAVYGHTHTKSRLNGVVNVGTSTELILPYNKDGLSNWVQSLAVVGPNGEIQDLDFMDGEFFRRPTDLIRPSSQFFPPGYPRAIPNQESRGMGQIDQFGGGTKLLK